VSRYRQEVLNILARSDTRVSANAFIKAIQEQFSVSSRCARTILKELVDDQVLSYQDLYGTTYVETNFLKPVHISKHFTLQPWKQADSNQSQTIDIVVHQGISFGSGQHPTTRLFLMAIDDCLLEKPCMDMETFRMGADIGTGSGVLAIALCRSGRLDCIAYDIDPIAVNEAQKNIALNRLENRIDLKDTPFTQMPDYFSVICANLRWPTLYTLADSIRISLKENGVAILSGVRPWEKNALIDWYADKHFSLLWQKDEKNWSAFVLMKHL